MAAFMRASLHSCSRVANYAKSRNTLYGDKVWFRSSRFCFKVVPRPQQPLHQSLCSAGHVSSLGGAVICRSTPQLRQRSLVWSGGHCHWLRQAEPGRRPHAQQHPPLGVPVQHISCDALQTGGGAFTASCWCGFQFGECTPDGMMPQDLS